MPPKLSIFLFITILGAFASKVPATPRYPTLKRALADLKRKRLVRCLGKGRDAQWERTKPVSH